MNVIFLGFQSWGYATLKALLASRHVVSLVVTHPQSHHEYEAIWNASVKDLALAHDIPVIESKHFNKEDHIRRAMDLKPDIFVLSDWRTWLHPDVYKIPTYGSINIHDALLPKYGGFAPINWAIINGEEETGVTVHFVQDDFDLGDIILQQRVPIRLTETATDIFHKVIPLCADLALEALDLIEYDRVQPIPQSKQHATFYHKRVERDSFIRWEQSSINVYNLIRAQSDPYPNAYTYHKGKKLKVKKASLPDKCYCGMPGRVFSRLDNGVVVVCGQPQGRDKNQGIVLELVQTEDGEVLEANRYFRKMGEYLSNPLP